MKAISLIFEYFPFKTDSGAARVGREQLKIATVEPLGNHIIYRRWFHLFSIRYHFFYFFHSLFIFYPFFILFFMSYSSFIIWFSFRDSFGIRCVVTRAYSIGVTSTCVKSISPKMKTVHLLTRNVQIIAQSWINIWCGFNDRRHSLWHGLIEGIEVLRGQSVSRPSFQIFTISDLNKPTS